MDPINDPENDAIEDDARFLCACGDSECWQDGNDPSNIRLGRVWFGESCGHQHPVIVADMDQAYRLDRERGK